MVRISFSAVSSLLILSASTSIFSLASTNGNKEETADGNEEGTVVGEDVLANVPDHNVSQDVLAHDRSFFIAISRFFFISIFWVFYHDDGSIDALSETPGQCMWNAKSDVIGESISPSYDILSSGSWFTKNNINAIVPMQQFIIKCHKCDGNPDFCGYPVRGESNKVKSLA